MFGISPKAQNVLKFLGGLHSYLRRQVMLFNPRMPNKVYVQAWCLKMDKNKESNGSKQTNCQSTSKEGKKKWKG
jgi:hypothetical protein